MAVIAAYAHKIIRVTISGTTLGGAEVWSTGFYLGSPTADMTGAAAPAAQTIAGAWETFFEHADSNISSAYTTTQVKCALLNEDGSTDLDEIDYYTYPTPILGQNVGGPLPAQISLTATLTSDNQRGLAAKGRMYLPGVNAAISSTTGKISSSATNNISGTLKTFFDAVNAGTGVPGQVILASKGRKIANSEPQSGDTVYAGGVNAVVTGLRVGDVYDTQRRRRNQLTETYSTKVLA